jgi:SAM-dependent methyltransferase
MLRAGDYWDAQVVSKEAETTLWMSAPEIREYIAQNIGGDRLRFGVEWLRDVAGRRFERALSIGCGAGGFERSLISLDLCDRVDALDAGVFGLHEARRSAREAGIGDRIHYFAADFNRPAFARARYDLVVCHQSLHHVSKLERLYREIRKALRPGGLLFLDEYVGPSRNGWTDALLVEQRAFYDALPLEWRTRPRLYAPYLADDPSEAIRAAEILPQLDVGFTVRDRRSYGGWYAAVIFEHIDWSRAPRRVVEDLIACDRAALLAGKTLYVALLAEPRTGWSGSLADLRYMIWPKLKYSWRFNALPRIRRMLGG